MATKVPNILLFGAGSIGSVFIYQFQRAGCKVTAVCRSNYNAVKANGYTLYSKRYGDVKFKPDHVVRVVDDCPPNEFYDFVFCASKVFPGSKPSLADMLKPALSGRKDTAIVLAQNGMAIEDEIAAAYPENPIISACVYLPASQTEQGVIHYPEMLNLLELGTFPSNAPPSHKAVADKLVELIAKGGGAAEHWPDIQVARWNKLLLNGPWNPICALSLCSDGDFLLSSEPFARDLVWGVMTEIIALAKKIGIPGVDEKVAESKFNIAQKRAETGTGREVSMLQDVKQGRLIEIESLLGSVVRLGRKEGVSMPRVETIYALAKGRYDALLRAQEKQNGNMVNSLT